VRVAVLLADKCQPRKCQHECEAFCPVNRQGTECIVIPEGAKPIISETTCIGCGICVHKCPFDAIRIIGLPEALNEDMIHRFGENSFRLFRLPVPKAGQVVGILGPNGIGKTTALRILSGEQIPNLGDYENPEPTWATSLDHYAGTDLGDYLTTVSKGNIKVATKPQYVDKLPKVMNGNVGQLLKKVDQTGRHDHVIQQLDLENALTRDIQELSGGELQRVAIAATLLKNADVYFFDEPSSYLDINQRLRMARAVAELAADKPVLVIEHDLAILDFLAANIHLVYGEEGAYGVFTQPKGARHAINLYLDGYLKEENIRTRDYAIEFTSRPPKRDEARIPLLEFPLITKAFDGFKLEVDAGTIHHGEVVGVVGPNATGKTTFVKILAGVLESDKGKLSSQVRVAYKPQYVKADFDGTVQDLLYTKAPVLMESSFHQSEVIHPLKLKNLYQKQVNSLSGGELQRVAIALNLSSDADIYLIDEPSAYLDSNQRMVVARTIRRVLEKEARAGLIVDHDVYFIDMVSDSMMVFGGDPGRHGIGRGPLGLRQGMNAFLKDLGVTFRRDPDTKRPRINKPDSRLDREQRQSGEYYYREA
jgi:ATP-binding cassette, sub-family E, member 1